MNRYSRQIVYLGEDKQKRLESAKVCLVGCGAIGSVSASLLVRAGINIKIIDRDFVDLSNIQRTELFDEKDVDKPKALAAKEKLEKINSGVSIEAVVEDLNPRNMDMINSDLILDCTDNLETRHLINEYCVKNKIKWIYAGAVGVEGMSAAFLNSCFRCIFPEQANLDTCETAGILAPPSHIIASWQVLQAMKILTGEPDYDNLFSFSLDNQKFSFSKIKKNPDCEVCVKKNYSHLSKNPDGIITLCGKNSYQINKPEDISLLEFKKKLEPNPEYEITGDENILHIKHQDMRLSLFKNKRAIIYADSQQRAQNFYKKIFPR